MVTGLLVTLGIMAVLAVALWFNKRQLRKQDERRLVIEMREVVWLVLSTEFLERGLVEWELSDIRDELAFLYNVNLQYVLDRMVERGILNCHTVQEYPGRRFYREKEGGGQQLIAQCKAAGVIVRIPSPIGSYSS